MSDVKKIINETQIIKNNSTDVGGLTIFEVKAITSVILLIAALLGIFLPLLIVTRLNIGASTNTRFTIWVGRLSCFAAGVFLSTGLMDVLPDVFKSTAEAKKYLSLNKDYPFASLFTLCGFFLVLCIEQSIALYKHNHSKKHIHLNEAFQRTQNDDIIETDDPSTNSQKQLTPDLDNENNVYIRLNEGHRHCEDSTAEPGKILHRESGARAVALMSAMSIHAILEGLAIGLAQTISGVARLTIALGIHKVIVSGSLGMSMINDMHRWILVISLGLIFSLACPIGLMTGAGVLEAFKENHDQNNGVFFIVIGALNGLACGTFLFVVFMELLPHQLGHTDLTDRPLKILSILIGFGVVCIFIFINPET